MKPVLPYVPVIGDRMFFLPLNKRFNRVLSYYGRVTGTRKSRVVVRLINGVGSITFDPLTGRANPNFQFHDLCWIGDDSYKGLDYNDAMARAEEEMKAAEATS